MTTKLSHNKKKEKKKLDRKTRKVNKVKQGNRVGRSGNKRGGDGGMGGGGKALSSPPPTHTHIHDPLLERLFIISCLWLREALAAIARA